MSRSEGAECLLKTRSIKIDIPLHKMFSKSKGNEGIHDHPKIRLLTIWFGANDAVLPQFVQHVPLDEYAANLRTLIRMVRAPDSAWYAPHTKVVLITPPPVNVPQWSTRLDVEPGTPIDRDLAVTEKYTDAVREVGRSEGVVVCDVFAPLWEAAGKKEEGLAKFMHDGLHLNADGYAVSDYSSGLAQRAVMDLTNDRSYTRNSSRRLRSICRSCITKTYNRPLHRQSHFRIV